MLSSFIASSRGGLRRNPSRLSHALQPTFPLDIPTTTRKGLNSSHACYDILHITAKQCATSHGNSLRRLQRSRLKIQVPDLRAEILLHQMLQTTQGPARSRSATQPSKSSWKCASEARSPGDHPADREARHVDSCFGSRVQASVDALPDSARSTWRDVCAYSGARTG